MRLSIVLLLVLSNPSRAITCQLLEAEGETGSGKTKIEASKKVWESCIDRKLIIRHKYRKDILDEEILGDAEACLNAKMVCK